MIDKRPLMIARCVDVADVMTAVNFGRDQGLRIAIRGGGHNGPGLARSQIQAPAEAPDVEILPWLTGRSGKSRLFSATMARIATRSCRVRRSGSGQPDLIGARLLGRIAAVIVVHQHRVFRNRSGRINRRVQPRQS
jgi:hypothetical protein